MNQKQEKNRGFEVEGRKENNASDSCMFMMAVPEYLSKKLEAHIDDPSKMFEIICDKYDEKGNNKLSNLCK